MHSRGEREQRGKKEINIRPRCWRQLRWTLPFRAGKQLPKDSTDTRTQTREEHLTSHECFGKAASFLSEFYMEAPTQCLFLHCAHGILHQAEILGCWHWHINRNRGSQLKHSMTYIQMTSSTQRLGLVIQ